jgi:hypothetical protein
MTRAFDVIEDVASLKSSLYRLQVEIFAQRGLDFDAGHRLRDLFGVLEAVRFICRHPDAEQYKTDIETIADSAHETHDVIRWLQASGFDRGDICDWFKTAEDNDYIRTEDGHFAAKDVCSYCDNDDVYYYSDDGFSSVIVSLRNGRWNSETWSESAIENNAFWCDVSEEYYSCTAFDRASTVTGLDICAQWAQRNDWYYHVDENEWSREPPDDEDNDSGIPDYHDAVRRWDLTIANRSTRAFYGFEIEVDFPNSDDRREFWGSHLACDDSFCGELDGSLDDDTGLEIISRPFAMDELRTPNNRLKNMLAEARREGAHVNDRNYGVHITSNWGRLTNDHKNRLCEAVCSMRALSVFVSRRYSPTYAEYTPYDGDKHVAMNRRDQHAVEMRTFLSTTDWPMLMSYVEYLDALTEWTRSPLNPIAGALAPAQFRAWVRSRPDYPHLARRFAPKETAHVPGRTETA